jgi:hypothetical protein
MRTDAFDVPAGPRRTGNVDILVLSWRNRHDPDRRDPENPAEPIDEQTRRKYYREIGAILTTEYDYSRDYASDDDASDDVSDVDSTPVENENAENDVDESTADMEPWWDTDDLELSDDERDVAEALLEQAGVDENDSENDHDD